MEMKAAVILSPFASLRACDFFQFEQIANAADRARTYRGCHPEESKATKDLHFVDFDIFGKLQTLRCAQGDRRCEKIFCHAESL